MRCRLPVVCFCFLSLAAIAEEPVAIAPTAMKRVGRVSERFQSYNVEMVEVTGGRFWAPYRTKGQAEAAPAAKLATPGIDPSAFRMRSPIDLSNARLRKLAAALGPAYVRVSGTWANSTYFFDGDGAAPAAPPAGFGGVLTKAEWKGVIDFAKAVDAGLVTSFAVSAGVRDAQGVWSPVEARKVAAFTKASGGRIAAAEMFNEPNFAAMGGAPKGYDAVAYGKDFAVFRAFARKSLPGMLILGPGSVGEGGTLAANSTFSGLKSEDMLKATGRGVDVFSYHFYGSVSKRCAFMPGTPQTSPATALSAEWLAKTEQAEEYYAALRDRFEPGKPIWLTETGETACGGNPWAATFVDSFRYLNQLGTLAKRGVQVVAHNTLAASDYALLDEEHFDPRPNYWSALLWHKLMGTTVLDAGAAPSPDVHLYAHCLIGVPGGVAVLAINADRTAEATLETPLAASRYLLSAEKLDGPDISLNGQTLRLGAGDQLPALEGSAAAAGKVALPAASITFLTFATAGNANCR